MQRFFFVFLAILLAFIIASLPNPDQSRLQAAPLQGGPPEQYRLLPLQNIKQIAAGKSHTCAVTEDSRVKCWGANDSGQLGNNSNIHYPLLNSPAAIDVDSLISGISAIAVGGAHTCAITNSGGVKCWGNNMHGQLGNGSFGNSNHPVDVFGLDSDVIAITAGELHTCALLHAGSVQCWGTTYDQQTRQRDFDPSLMPEDVPGLQEPVVALAAGWYHTCALTSTGAVKCWGEGADGQLGNSKTAYSRTPVDVQGLGSDVIAIASGERHSCALRRGAGILCWGNNNNGQLGSEGIRYSSAPVKLQIAIDNAISLTAGGDHTCALTAVGDIHCWGANDAGQLGANGPRDSPVPLPVTGLNDAAIAVSAGGSHTCALTRAGSVECWGNSAEGRLGDNKIDNSSRSVPVSGLDNVAIALVAGDAHTCALTNVGGVKCWGSNHYGQLGNNNINWNASVAIVDGLHDGVVALAAGANHTCALTDVGAVLCWGNNAAGQLGNNSQEDSSVPVAVSGLGRNVKALVADMNYTCALTDVGELLCWGANNLGPLPWQINSQANPAIPIQMNSSNFAKKVTAIAAQGNLICALYDVGTVECWGQDNTQGLSATYENLQSIPIPLVWFKGVKESPISQVHGSKTAASGSAHTCSLTDVGGVLCWGANDSGQLGNGSVRKITPVTVLEKIIITSGNEPQSLLPAPTPSHTPSPTPTVAPTITATAEVSLLPTITPTPPGTDLLPAPLYFLAPDQQIWQLTGSVSNLISQTVTHEPWPIVSFDFSPIHGRFVYITDNQLVEFDPKTNTRIVKTKAPILLPTQADGRYTIEQTGSLVLGTPRYSPDGTQIAYTHAGVNLVSSGFGDTSTPQRLLRNVRLIEPLMTPLASTVDWSTDVELIRLYSDISWSPDGEKLLIGYSGWEWYGYDIYDRITNSTKSLPIGVAGDWSWSKHDGLGIMANGGYGGPFESGLFLVNSQDATIRKLDLGPLGISAEENPFTPLVRAPYESTDGSITFFMGTRFLNQDNNHHVLFALAKVDLATNAMSWVQEEKKGQEVELGEVLWAADGSGVVNSLSPNTLQWLPTDGRPAIGLGVIGNHLRWGATPTEATAIPVPTFTATATTVPTGTVALPSTTTERPVPTVTATPAFITTPVIIQSNQHAADPHGTDAQMATIAKLDALCPVEKEAMFLTAIYCFGFDFNLNTRGPGVTTDDEVHLFLLPVADNVSESQNADDAYVKLDIYPVQTVDGQPQHESAADCRVQPTQRSSALDNASFAISRYQVVYTEYRCGAAQLLRKDLRISQPPSPTIQVTFAALPGTDTGRFDKLFAAFAESFTFYSPDQLASPSTVSLLPTVTATPTAVPTILLGTPIPNIEQRIGEYTVRIWNSFNYPTHLPSHGYYGTATLTHDDGRELIIEDAVAIQSLPTSDINGDGYPDLALKLRGGGSHCCVGVVVYTLDDVPTKLVATFDPGLPASAGGFKDLDQDGIYEFITGDDIGYCNGGATTLTVLRYDPAQGYIASSYLFRQAYEEILAKQLADAKTRQDMCSVSGMTYNYLYMGLPIQAWENFTRLHSSDLDIFDYHEQMEQRALAGKFFAAKPPGVQTMNDFAVDQAGQLNQFVQFNDIAGVNQVAISLSPDKDSAGYPQNQFLELSYAIQGEAGQRYVGLERCFAEEQDWSQTPTIDLALRNPVDYRVSFFLQFGEGKRCGNEPFPGEVWRTAVTLQPHESRILTLSLDSAQTFARTDWSPQQNGQIDLQQVGYFAIGVETDAPQQGVLQISPIRLWP